MSTPRETSTRPSATVIDRCGTKSPFAPCEIEPSASTAYTNVATNVPSVICVPAIPDEVAEDAGPELGRCQA